MDKPGVVFQARKFKSAKRMKTGAVDPKAGVGRISIPGRAGFFLDMAIRAFPLDSLLIQVSNKCT
jgi:hypothetical protein